VLYSISVFAEKLDVTYPYLSISRERDTYGNKNVTYPFSNETHSSLRLRI